MIEASQIALRGPYFDAMFEGPWAANRGEGPIEIQDIDFKTFKRLIDWLENSSEKFLEEVETLELAGFAIKSHRFLPPSLLGQCDKILAKRCRDQKKNPFKLIELFEVLTQSISHLSGIDFPKLNFALIQSLKEKGLEIVDLKENQPTIPARNHFTVGGSEMMSLYATDTVSFNLFSSELLHVKLEKKFFSSQVFFREQRMAFLTAFKTLSLFKNVKIVLDLTSLMELTKQQGRTLIDCGKILIECFPQTIELVDKKRASPNYLKGFKSLQTVVFTFPRDYSSDFDFPALQNYLEKLQKYQLKFRSLYEFATSAVKTEFSIDHLVILFEILEHG